MNILIVTESLDSLFQEGHETIQEAIDHANQIKGTVRLSITDDNSTYDFTIQKEYLATT